MRTVAERPDKLEFMGATFYLDLGQLLDHHR